MIFVPVSDTKFYLTSSSASIATSGSQPIALSPVASTCSPFNSQLDSIQVWETGLYYLHMSAGVPANTAAYYEISGLVYPAVIYKVAIIWFLLFSSLVIRGTLVITLLLFGIVRA